MVVLLRRPAGLKLAVHLVRAFGQRRCLHACERGADFSVLLALLGARP